jgi:adenosylcobinamide-GDP ribazoletransferase
MVWLIQWFPYARPEGKASFFMENRPVTDLVFAAALTIAAGYYVLGNLGIAVLCACTILTHMFGVWMSRRLGGLTGDTYGAACELTETALLLYLSMILN